MRGAENRGTHFLFARASFLEGVARLFDFRGSLNEYNLPRDPNIAIAEAWLRVGDAMWSALGQYERETGTPITRAEPPAP